jgi:tripartite-type tricarboxylate transporter receptor subunit TctC
MKRTFATILSCCLAALAASASAQDYPQRPVRIMVPYAAGGVPDVVARTVAQRLSESTGQQFIVENRGGGGGIAAVMAVAKSPADGYTLLVADPAQTAINPFLFTNLPYDTLRDLAPVSIIANSVQYVVGSPQANINSFPDMVAYAKANPGKLSYGSAGIGSVHHIGMESIKGALGLNVVHIPYKGSGQSVPAFVAGEVQVVLASLPALTAHVKAGKAKLLAVTSARRSPQTPDVPAVSEFVPGYDFGVEIGMLAPAGTPPAVLTKLSGEVGKAMKHPDTAARFAALGLEPVGGTPENYTAVIRRSLERFSVAVKQSGAKAD